MTNKTIYLSTLIILLATKVLANDSYYTPLEESKCIVLESSANDPEAEIDYFELKCPGRDGYWINVSGGDLRSHIVVKKDKTEIYDSRLDVYENRPGGFPHVDGNVLEWRYNKDKKLIGLIFRIAGQDMKSKDTINGRDITTLFVIRHFENEFCYIGKTTSNTKARKMLDQATSCPVQKPVTTN